MADSAAPRRWWLLGIVLLLAVLNVVAWSGWRPAKDRLSSGDLEQLRATFAGPAFEFLEEDYERIESGLVPVLVVDMQNEQPIARAAVWLSEQGWLQSHTGLVGGFDGLADFPPAEAVHTDARGIAWIPAPLEHCLVIANSGGFGGWSFFNPGEPLDALARCRQIKLVCSIPRGAGLRVERPMDASGLPLPVFMRSAHSLGRMPLRIDPDGSGEIACWMDMVNLGWTDEDEDLPLRLVPGFCEDAAIPLTKRILRKGQVKLPAPPTGEILVKLHGLEGSALDVRAAVYLEEAGQPWTNRRALGTEDQLAGIAEAGALSLRGVPLGKTWNVGYRLPGVLGKVSSTIAGPVRAGETVTVLEPVQAFWPLMVRLHHADGSALAEREIWVVLNGKDGEEDIRDFGTVLSDPDGSVEISYAMPLNGAWQSVEFSFAGDAQDPACHTKELPIPESGELGEQETWLQESHRAWGVVEDAEGGEVPRARVGLDAWQDQPVAPDGSFQLSGSELEPATPFEVFASGPWHLPARVLCEAPNRKVRIHLRHGSRVHGRLLLPSTSRSYRVVIEALGAQSVEPELEEARAEYDVFTRHGWFECGPLPAGTWDLRVRVGGIVVAEVPGAVLVAGEVLRDPRLAAIDLRDHVQMFVGLALKEGRGTPERAYVMIEMPDGQRLLADQGGLLIPPDAVRVGVAAPGFKEVWVPVKSGDVKILLVKE